MMIGSGFAMMLFGLLVLVGLVLLGVALVRGLSGRNVHPSAPSTQPSQPRATGRQILEERYARGELTTEEYQERLRGLRGDT